MSENFEYASTTCHQFIGSFAWNSGILAASFYDIETMELQVTQEGIDLRPDFPHLHNLFRQFRPVYVCISGTKPFIKEIAVLMNIPSDDDIEFPKTRNKFSILSNVAVFSRDEKSIFRNRRRVMDLQLPGMTNNLTDSERSYFLESVIPIKQTLVVHSIGNLLHYLDVNYKRILLSESKPVITDVRVFVMESQLIVDNTTFDGLQVFSSKYHPSGFKKGDRVANDFSLYTLIGRECCSEIGRLSLKVMLEKPTRDLAELNLRYATIEWCSQMENQTNLVKLKQHLKKLTNLNSLFRKIMIDNGKPSEWKTFFVCLYNMSKACVILQELDEEKISSTLLFDLFKTVKEEDATLNQILFLIDRVCNIEQSIAQNKFTVQDGLDRELDRKKIEIEDVVTTYSNLIQNQLCQFRDEEKEVIYYPGFKFIIRILNWNTDLNPNSFESEQISYIITTNGTAIFKTDLCHEMDIKHGALYADICEHENRMCGRLVNIIYENLSVLQGTIDLCAKLDCLMAMAHVSLLHNYVRPDIGSEKYIEILQARHPLTEAINNFIPTDAVIRRDNYLTILHAPNASGKSVYIKTIGLVIYMAHVGCFVPARSAKLFLLDGIFSTIYTPESTYYGTSSFLWELQQLSRSLINSSTNSLILLDEFGKGTNVEEGSALLIASLESLIARGDLMPITVLATHYNNINDKLKDKSYSKMKTIEMICDEKNHVTTTYRIIDETSETKAQSATNTLTTTKELLREILDDSTCQSLTLGDESGNLTDDKLSQKRIKFSFDLLKKYLTVGSISEEDVFK